MTEKTLPKDASAPVAQPATGGSVPVGNSEGTGRGGRFWVVTAATVVAVVVTASLGQWQLGRAAQKNDLVAQREAREALSVLVHADMAERAPALLRAGPEDAEVVGLHDRAAALRGQWIPEATVFLDNRTMDGRVGFLVLTPLRLDGSAGVILVQRGWVPRSFEDRTALPEVPTPEYPVEVSGRLAPPPSKLYEFQNGGTGQIRQNIDLAEVALEWRLPLLPLTLQQGTPQASPDAPPDGLLREWPRVGYDVHKHYGYAFQWFGLCGLLLTLYVWFQFIAPRRRQP